MTNNNISQKRFLKRVITAIRSICTYHFSRDPNCKLAQSYHVGKYCRRIYIVQLEYMLYMFTVLSPQGIKGSQCHFMLWREAKETVLLKLRNWAQLDNPDISHHHFKTKLILLWTEKRTSQASSSLFSYCLDSNWGSMGSEATTTPTVPKLFNILKKLFR